MDNDTDTDPSIIKASHRRPQRANQGQACSRGHQAGATCGRARPGHRRHPHEPRPRQEQARGGQEQQRRRAERRLCSRRTRVARPGRMAARQQQHWGEKTGERPGAAADTFLVLRRRRSPGAARRRRGLALRPPLNGRPLKGVAGACRCGRPELGTAHASWVTEA